jgi:hypothetical protein
MDFWDWLEQVDSTFRWESDRLSARVADIVDPPHDHTTCSACGGTGDCPRCGGNMYIQEWDEEGEKTGPSVPCDLCRTHNHCAYCNRTTDFCYRCGNLLQQYDDGHVEHSNYEGGVPTTNTRDESDPRGPRWAPCPGAESSRCPTCKGRGDVEHSPLDPRYEGRWSHECPDCKGEGIRPGGR